MREMLKCFAASFLFCFSTAPCGAEVRGSSIPSMNRSSPLVLDAVLRSLSSAHPLLHAAKQRMNFADGEVLSAEGAFDTRLSAEASGFATGEYSAKWLNTEITQPLRTSGLQLTAGYRTLRGSIPSYYDDLLTGSDGEARAGVLIPLLRDRTIDNPRAQVMVSALQRALAEIHVDQRMLELTLAARVAYWTWVASGERVRINAKLLQVARDRGKQISERVRSGDLPAFDEQDNVRAVYQREIQLNSAERALLKAAFDLSLFLRDSTGSPIVPGKELLPNGLERPKRHGARDVLTALVRHPEIKRLQAEIERTEIEEELARNQGLPRVDFRTEFSNDLGRSDFASTQGELRMGLRVELPFQNRVAQGKAQQAKSRRRELELTLRFLKQKISTDIQDRQAAIELAEQRYATALKESLTAGNLEQGERTRLALGDSNLVFVNLREQTTAEASIRAVDALLDYHIGLAEYDAAFALQLTEVSPAT